VNRNRRKKKTVVGENFERQNSAFEENAEVVEQIVDNEKEGEPEQAVDQRKKKALQKIFGKNFHIRVQTVAGNTPARKSIGHRFGNICYWRIRREWQNTENLGRTLYAHTRCSN